YYSDDHPNLHSFPTRRSSDLNERIKDLFPKFGRYAGSRVRQPDLHSWAIVPGGLRDLRAKRPAIVPHRFIRILDQVHKRLLTETVIELCERQVVLILVFHSDFCSAPLLGHRLERA